MNHFQQVTPVFNDREAVVSLYSSLYATRVIFWALLGWPPRKETLSIEFPSLCSPLPWWATRTVHLHWHIFMMVYNKHLTGKLLGSKPFAAWLLPVKESLPLAAVFLPVLSQSMKRVHFFFPPFPSRYLLNQLKKMMPPKASIFIHESFLSVSDNVLEGNTRKFSPHLYMCVKWLPQLL